MGIVETRKAIEMAREVDLDLVEVAPNADPPVCRIMDFGKYKYDQKKKERRTRSKHHSAEMKEVRVKTPKISRHDLDIKINRARQFLQRGDRVQFTLRFRGREMAHVEMGKEIFEIIKASLIDVSKIEREPRLEGRRLVMILSPSTERTRSTRKPRSGQSAPDTPESKPDRQTNSSAPLEGAESADKAECRAQAD